MLIIYNVNSSIFCKSLRLTAGGFFLLHFVDEKGLRAPPARQWADMIIIAAINYFTLSLFPTDIPQWVPFAVANLIHYVVNRSRLAPIILETGALWASNEFSVVITFLISFCLLPVSPMMMVSVTVLVREEMTEM
jgi:hypothetical protein